MKRDVAASAKARLDRAVKDGDLTEKQAKAILDHIDEHIDRLGSARGFGPPRGPGGPRDFDGHGGPGGFHPGPGGMHR